jgi:3-hydroxy-9,10-secoandrosta-1,3,5(10)-triene-9,17-dione monooxygenase
MPGAPTKQDLIDRARALAPIFAKRADAAEQARRLPAESIKDMLDAGFARMLMPERYGGYGLDFETWNEVVLAISRADASHGWCASLIIHHAHVVGQCSEEAQQATWANGPDVAISASFAPRAQVARAPGGYRVSGDNLTFASGVDHSTWVIVGGFVRDDGTPPEWTFFLIPPGEYTVRDVWFTAGMRGTGSNTIIIDNVFVPETRVITRAELRQGNGPGGALHANSIFRVPFYFYAPLTFAGPMLGAAQGAYEQFREATKTRKSVDGSAVAGKAVVQVSMARAAADLDAADLLLRRAACVRDVPHEAVPPLLARSLRDYSRVSELTISVIDTLMTLSGTAGFSSSQPIQRAWRDIHFAATHIALNTESNYGYFGRTALGQPPDPGRQFFDP